MTETIPVTMSLDDLNAMREDHQKQVKDLLGVLSQVLNYSQDMSDVLDVSVGQESHGWLIRTERDKVFAIRQMNNKLQKLVAENLPG